MTGRTREPREPATPPYVGDVTPGGPAQVRELPGLTIRKLAVSSMSNNVYLLTDTATGDQLLVDAADAPEEVLQLVAAGTGRLAWVVTTHRHWDHHRALAAVVEATGARTAAGADDADALPVRPDRRLEQGDTLHVGDVSLEVVHLRGHTPGSIALAYEDADGRTHLFTGDSLFPGGVGNTKDEGQSFDDLIADVTERVFDVYDDDTWVYPGHGGDTVLGRERPQLSQWRERGW
ncbi:MAG: MBL fold metallo-hydrolase [Actinomycetota bacterium]|nr:MBL fold metallo-hydrolase [Actinomycetota bacterium]